MTTDAQTAATTDERTQDSGQLTNMPFAIVMAMLGAILIGFSLGLFAIASYVAIGVAIGVAAICFILWLFATASYVANDPSLTIGVAEITAVAAFVIAAVAAAFTAAVAITNGAIAAFWVALIALVLLLLSFMICLHENSNKAVEGIRMQVVFVPVCFVVAIGVIVAPMVAGGLNYPTDNILAASIQVLASNEGTDYLVLSVNGDHEKYLREFFHLVVEVDSVPFDSAVYELTEITRRAQDTKGAVTTSVEKKLIVKFPDVDPKHVEAIAARHVFLPEFRFAFNPEGDK